MKSKSILGIVVSVILLVASILLAVQTRAAEKTVEIDGQLFTAVHFNGAATLHITQSSKAELVASGSNDVLDDLSVTIRNDTLFIETEKDYGFLFNNDSDDILITLVVVNMAELSLKGSTEVRVHGLDVKELSIQVSGASDVVFEDLFADSLTINATGANEFSIDGEVDSQNISLKGASDYDAVDLLSETAVIMLAGAGDARIQVKAELNVRVYGVGEIAYLGSPKVNQSVRGMGSVKRISI